MSAAVINPFGAAASLWSKRNLVKQFALRDFQSRFKGTVFGFLWSLVLPLVMLLVYTFVFSVVFNARWGSIGGDSKAMFAVILFGNLIPFNLFSDVLGSSSGLMLQNQNLIKKVVFPLEVLPVSRLCAAVIQALASFLIFLCGVCFVGALHWQIIFAPLVLVPLMLYALGLSYMVSAVTVFVRDVGQLIGIFLTLLMFMSPVFYPADAVPAAVRPIFNINPMAIIIEQFRAVAVAGQYPDPVKLGVLWATSVAVALAGYAFFMKAKPSFADVL